MAITGTTSDVLCVDAAMASVACLDATAMAVAPDANVVHVGSDNWAYAVCAFVAVPDSPSQHR